jgi:hypothetical protein
MFETMGRVGAVKEETAAMAQRVLVTAECLQCGRERN